MRRPTSSRRAQSIAVLCLVGLLPACSSAKPTSHGAASPSRAAHSSTPAPTPTTAQPSASSLPTAHSDRATCSFGSEGDIATAFGATQIRYQQNANDGACDYELKGSPVATDISVVVNYSSLQNRSGFEAGRGAPEVAVVGVGDGAYYTPPPTGDPAATASIDFLKGPTVLFIIAGPVPGSTPLEPVAVKKALIAAATAVVRTM